MESRLDSECCWLALGGRVAAGIISMRRSDLSDNTYSERSSCWRKVCLVYIQERVIREIVADCKGLICCLSLNECCRAG